jgi:hypothetical protein
MKMVVKVAVGIMVGFAGLLVMTATGLGQSAAAPVPVYVNENDHDPAPLKLDGLSGKVQGLGGDAMPRAVVSLFTEQGHLLVASVNSDKDGKFRFDKVDKGLYRVVARVDGLCTANIPVNVGTSMLSAHKLVITMQPKDIDTCSYGMAKR